MKTHRVRVLFVCAAAASIAACGDDITEVTEIAGTTLVASVDEPAGENCADGGTAIVAGLDDNQNGVLDDAEIDSTTYVCATAATGAMGTTVLTADEPAGDNCPNGGTSITTGVDADGDGALTDAEITDVSYVCTGGGAGDATLTTVSDEAAGDNCEYGGVRLDAGADADGSGTLDEGEITSTSYACYPSTGGDDLLREETFAGNVTDACPGGYVSHAIGFDTDKSGDLGEGEVLFSITSCNAAPFFEADTTVTVDDCTVDFTFDVGAMDLDGTVETIDVEVRGSGAAMDPVVDGTSITIVGSDANAGGALFSVTATDNYGAMTSERFLAVFTGEGCLPPETFYGVDPASCVEIDVDDLAGDDRGSVTLTPTYAYYNGDDALVRVGRDLVDPAPEVVVEDYVDTLFSDGATLELYSFWSSGFEFDSIDEAFGNLEDDVTAFDQIVMLDEETLELGTPVDLERGFAGEENVTFGIDDVEVDLDVYEALVGLSDGRLVTAMYGYDNERGEDLIVYTVYDVTDGSVLSTWAIDETEDGFYDHEWQRQEVDIGHNPVVIRDDVEYLVTRSDDDGQWYETNVRTGERALVSSTYVRGCDSHHLSVDFSTLQAYGHAEGGCWTEEYVSESIFACDLLLAPNVDGVIDDSGVRDFD